MENIKAFFKKNLILIFLIVLAIIPRFFLLDKVPNATNEDQLHYIIDGRSFALTGKDVYSQVSPLDVLLFHSPTSEPLQAELQYFLEIPTVGLFGFSLFNAVFLNAVLSVLLVLLIYLITLKLFNKNAALFAGFIASINPWLIFSGRTTYEAGVAMFFFALVFYIFINTKGGKILLNIPIALLAFYSYIGTKLIFVPFIFITSFYSYFYINTKKYFNKYLLVFIFSVLITGFFFFQFKQYQVSRNAEVLLPNNPEIVRQVIEFRKIAIQSPFIDIFDNKLSVYLTVLTKNFLNIFSATYLFMSSDFFFMLGGQGLFYFIDLIFLIFGLGFLFVKDRKLFFTIIGIIFLGIIPQVLHDPNGSGNFTPHIAVIIPFLIVLIGLGLGQVYKLAKEKKHARLFVFMVLGFYLALFANFSYFYFFKFPLQAGTFPIKYRLMSKYISLYKEKNQQVNVYSTNSKLAYREYIFYTDAYKTHSSSTINSSLKTLTLDNIKFLSCSEIFPKGVVLVSDYNCGKQPSGGAVSIAQPIDSGPLFNIYNDKICKNIGLPRYITNIKLSDFAVESLSSSSFCKTFMVSY